MKNIFDGLQGKVLPEGFKWQNEPPQWEFCAEGLTVKTAGQVDFFRDPAGSTPQDSAHYLFTQLAGDFTVSTWVKAEMLDDFDAGCLLIRFAEDVWGKLCYEYTYKRPMIISVVTQGVSDDANSLEVPATGVYLRVTRFGDCFAFHYSLDGEWWEMVRYFNLNRSGPVEVGVVAQAPTGPGCTVQFANLKISSIPVTEIRSGK